MTMYKGSLISEKIRPFLQMNDALFCDDVHDVAPFLWVMKIFPTLVTSPAVRRSLNGSRTQDCLFLPRKERYKPFIASVQAMCRSQVTLCNTLIMQGWMFASFVSMSGTLSTQDELVTFERKSNLG